MTRLEKGKAFTLRVRRSISSFIFGHEAFEGRCPSCETRIEVGKYDFDSAGANFAKPPKECPNESCNAPYRVVLELDRDERLWAIAFSARAFLYEDSGKDAHHRLEDNLKDLGMLPPEYFDRLREVRGGDRSQ